MSNKYESQIMEDFIAASKTFKDIDRHISIFGSARTPEEAPEFKITHDIAKALAERGHHISSGAGPGMMLAANKGAKAGGGLSIGISIELPFEEATNDYIDVLSHHRTFAIRKWFLITRSKAIVITKGGLGTLDEMCATLCLLATKRISRKLPIVLVGVDYWSGLVEWLKNSALGGGTISASDLDLFILTDSIEETVEYIENNL